MDHPILALITSHGTFQLPEKRFRLCVEIVYEVLGSLDPSIISFDPSTDSITSVKRKAAPLLANFLTDIGNHAGFQRREFTVFWPKAGVTRDTPNTAGSYESFAYFFDHDLDGNSEPSILKLVSKVEDGGKLGFELVKPEKDECIKILILSRRGEDAEYRYGQQQMGTSA
ncbi:hypothetical protein E8E14_011470 [Neopestalotiopsis sp. 37M]|nr:hypothetical protein E8E14_011470 [Neopestalotiopsis sp. 37M]